MRGWRAQTNATILCWPSCRFTDEKSKVLRSEIPRQDPPTAEATTEPLPLNYPSCLFSPTVKNCRATANRDRVFLFNMHDSTAPEKKSFLWVSLINRTELQCQGSELIAMPAWTVRNNGLLVWENAKQPLQILILNRSGGDNESCLLISQCGCEILRSSECAIYFHLTISRHLF